MLLLAEALAAKRVPLHTATQDAVNLLSYGSSRVLLPGGRTPRPFAGRAPRGPHRTPPTVRAGPTPTVAGCSRAAPERPLPKRSHLAARNPSAPPMPPDPTTLRPRPDLASMFRNRQPIASSASAKCATISAIDHFSGAGRRINSLGATSRRRRSSCDGVACWTAMGS